MPVETVTIHVAKTTLSQLLTRVEAGEEIILARETTGRQTRAVPTGADKASVWRAARNHQRRSAIFRPLA
jgi:hypothetical protein